MFKNVSGQKVTFLVLDTGANTPKTGDAANLTAYVSKDDGAVTVLGDTSAAEKDATNAPGLYDFDLAQGETNADKLVFSGKSSTSGIRVIPLLLYTRANNVNDLVIDASGNLTGNLVGTVSTVTTLTNLPAVPANWLTAAGIAADAFTAAKFAADCITAAKIATGAIDADAIADGAIDAGAIADGALTAAKLAADAITSAKIADNALTATKFATDSITAAALKADAVTEIQSGLATAAAVAAVQADTDDIQARIPAALVGGRMDASVGAMATNTLTAAALAADAVAEVKAAITNNTLDVDASGNVRANVIRSGTAQAGAASTITLDGGASANDDFYAGHVIHLTGGTGAGQVAICVGYVGATKVATVAYLWFAQPDATTIFAILPGTVNVGRWGISGLTGTGSGSLPAVSVSAVANNAITAAAIAAGAITSSECPALANLDAASSTLATAAAVAALNNLSSAQVTAAVPTVAQIWTTALTEAYRATGAAGTAAQLLYELLAGLLDHSISGTTKTTRKIDGTAAKTYTLDSSSAPTSITEAT